MNVNFYTLYKERSKTFDILPVITLGYDTYCAKGKFSIYFGWLFWGFEIYQE